MTREYLLDNPVGKIYSRQELEHISRLCVEHEVIILSDEVYDRLHYVPFTRIATLSPEVERLTLTVGSAGKNFYATGWRVGRLFTLVNKEAHFLGLHTKAKRTLLLGWLIGPANLIQHVAAAHTRICYSSVSPLQEACAIGWLL